MSVPQNIARHTAAGLAEKNGWPPGLLERVNAAIDEADPDGLDLLSTDPGWWRAIAEELQKRFVTAGEAELVAPLREVAEEGGRGAEPMSTADMAADFAGGVGSDIAGVAQGIRDAPKRGRGYGLAAVVGAALALWGVGKISKRRRL